MNMDMLEYLMEAGAKLHLHERDGWTAADHLEHNIEKLDGDLLLDEHVERAQLVLRKMRVSLQMLNSTGHNVNMVRKKGVSTVFVTEDDLESGKCFGQAFYCVYCFHRLTNFRLPRGALKSPAFFQPTDDKFRLK